MVTKWKNAENIFLNGIYIVIVCCFLILLGIIIMGISSYDYHPLLTAIMFVLGAILIVKCACSFVEYFDAKCRGMSWEEYFAELRRFQWKARMIVSGYLLIAALILFIGKVGWADCYFVELIESDMQWICICIFTVPPFAFCLPFVLEMENREAEMFSRLGQIMDQAVKESVKSEQMKVDLITNVSHDLKTPLTSIIGYLELMKKEEMSEVLRDYMEVISVKAELLKGMIEKVFDLAKATSGNVEFNLEHLDLNRLVNQIIADMQDILEEKKKIIKFHAASESTCFMADSIYMYRIVQNLLENAVKYSLDGTRIFIKTYVTKNEVFLEILNVANYPLDFDVSELKERFVRADQSRSTEGNGLGLAIVEIYTNAFRGSCEIETEGDVFKVILCFPLSEKGEEEKHEEGVSV